MHSQQDERFPHRCVSQSVVGWHYSFGLQQKELATDRKAYDSHCEDESTRQSPGEAQGSGEEGGDT